MDVWMEGYLGRRDALTGLYYYGYIALNCIVRGMVGRTLYNRERGRGKG